TILLCGTLTISLILWVGLRWIGGHVVFDADRFCIDHTSQYSPVRKEVDPHWSVVRFNGSLLKANVFRQDAGPEVDAAWESLGISYRSVVIPESEAERTGLLPDQVKISQSYGGGYPANVEGLHHLHCLDLMRKALWWNYDHYHAKGEGAFINSDYVVKYHVTHCMDIIRQQLMCTLDIGVLGQVWYQPEGEERATPYVDFNTQHTCRDFEAIRKWAEMRQLPLETMVDMSKFYEKPKPGDKIYTELP
ncbi:hypothetical protein GQ43DRAFT_337235, partial [Delitschia confertaspora ATCC 74209]